jgi:geranylgeranyl reductase family protein
MPRNGTDRVADVLVVGGGPAGATAARTLAAAGVSAALIDRAAFPRHKPCGGALSARVIGRFPYLGPALSRIATHWISKLHLEGPSGASVDLHADSPAALMIRRIEFDALLVTLAQEAGAQVITDAEVVAAEHQTDGVAVTTRDGRRFSARYAVASDGVHSVTARKLGIAGAWPCSALAIDMMEETPNADLKARDEGALWVQYGCSAPQSNGSRLWEGYGYVFPKRDHVNVGIGYLLGPYREAAPGPAYNSQRAFVERLKHDGVLEGRSRRDCFTPFLIPIAGPRRTLSNGRVLLAGDSAGFVHALTAEGIYYAMVSGELAAKAIINAVRVKERRVAPDLSSYSRAWRAEVGQELRDSVVLQRYLFGRRERVDGVVAGASGHDGLSGTVIRYLSGQLSYAHVRSRVLARNPGIVISLAADAAGRLWRSLRA